MASVTESQTVYRAWAAKVKDSGGVVTAFPAGSPHAGKPAARYPRDLITKLQAERRLGSPAWWTNSGEYGYYLPTTSVVQAARAVTAPTAAEKAQAAANVKQQWFGGFGEFLGGVFSDVKKLVILGGAAYLVVTVGIPLLRETLSSRQAARR